MEKMSSMNIAVINISLRPGAKVRYFPVGLGYVMTAIKDAGYKFDYIDQDLYNLSEDEVLKQLGQKYDVVLMGCIVTGYKYVKSLVSKIKQQSPHTMIAVGNSVATSIPEELLNHTLADIAILGEGDITDVELLDALRDGKDLESVDGIAYRSGKGDGKIIYTPPRKPIPDISKLYIDYTLFDIDSYIPYMSAGVSRPAPVPIEELKAFPINTARGCINKCTFCYHVFRDQRYRHRSMESIMDDIEQVITQYGVNYILFSDDLSFYNKKVITDFLDLKEQRNLDFYWNGTCRGNLFTEDTDLALIKRMQKNGCHVLGYSLESSNEEILKAMNKHVSLEDFKKQTRLLKQGGVGVSTSIVVGYPQETGETIKNTFDVCIACGISPSVGYLLPQPGSEIYDYAVEKGYIQDVEDFLLAMGDRQDLHLNMTSMKNDELEKITEQNIIRCNKALGVECIGDSLLKTQSYYIPKSGKELHLED